jgi:hypothetical protein
MSAAAAHGTITTADNHPATSEGHTMAKEKPKLHAVDNPPAEISVAKPSAFNLDKFKSKRGSSIANVGTLVDALPHHTIAQAKDFVRLHPDEENYWSVEFTFVNVPVKGEKRDTLHLIDDDLAELYVAKGKRVHFRFALATKPYDVFFLCHVPSLNLDNSWNASNSRACELAKSQWVQVTSRKIDGGDNYKVDFAREDDAFPEPKWPGQSLQELISVTFAGRMIDREDHPGLLRLIGAKQVIS